MVQWDKLKTEYATSQISYKELAEKYQIPYSTLKIHARCDRWVETRQEHLQQTMQKSLDLIGDRQAEDLARVDDLADQLLEKLQKAVDQLEQTVVQCKEKGESDQVKWEKTYEQRSPGGAVDTQGLKILAGCLKDLKQIKDLKSQLERREQEARIRKLQKEGTEETEISVSLGEEIRDFGV